MGLPIWREPTEKREIDAALDPRRAAVSRRSRLSDSSRPRIRASDRSSETLFNLLRSDYAHESMNVGSASSFSSERRGTFPQWGDVNALPTPVPDPERAALRVTLSDSDQRISRGGLRRMLSPLPVFRSEASRGSSASVSSEVYTRFPPSFPEREMVRERLEIEREMARDRLRQIERESERERERQDFDERRRLRQPFTSAVAESAAARRAADESGAPRFRFPARIQRHLADVLDESDSGRRSGSYVTRSLHLPRFDIDGLGDRERSLSPDVTQWELVANDIGFQAACDLWESEESDGEGGEGGENGELVIQDHLWDATQDRDEAFRMRRLTSLFSSRNRENRELDRLVERL